MTVGTRGPSAANSSFRRCCGRDKNQFTIQPIAEAEIPAYLGGASNSLGGKHGAFVIGFLFKLVSWHLVTIDGSRKSAFHFARFPSFPFYGSPHHSI